MKARLSLILLLPLIIVFASYSAHACSCNQTFTVKQKFEESGNVVIVRLVAINQTESEPAQFEFSVERVFKGTKKPGDQIRFRWENMCSPSFGAEQIGTRYLYFLGEKPDNDGFFTPSYCYGWGDLATQRLNLLYLEKPLATRQKTRIAGSVKKAFHDPNDDFEFKTEPIQGKRVRVTGSGISRVVTTDSDGNFEIYGLPPGKYRVYDPKIEGWQGTTDGFREVTLKAGGDAETLLFFEVRNVVSGHIIDRNGKPFDQVSLILFPEDRTATMEPVKSYGRIPSHDPFGLKFPTATTNDSGEFEFKGIAPGRYRLVVNRSGEVTAEQPFGAFFFPGTTEESKATVLTIGTGTKIENLVLTPPKLVEIITLRGRVSYQDGKPAEGSIVDFLEPGEAEGSRLAIDSTDQKGEFSIRVPKGTAGALQAWFGFFTDEVTDCPQLTPFLRGDYRGSHVIKTATIDIDGQTDRDNLDFVLPFAACPRKN